MASAPGVTAYPCTSSGSPGAVIVPMFGTKPTTRSKMPVFSQSSISGNDIFSWSQPCSLFSDQIITIRSGSAKGSEWSRIELTSVKIAVAMPMPSPRDSTAAIVKRGFFRRVLSA